MSTTTITAPISETVSEKPKAKRGRPKSFHRICADSSQHTNGCQRTKVNFQLLVSLFAVTKQATPEEHLAIFGCSRPEMHTKWGGNLPPGTYKAGIEIGRYIDAIGDTDENKAMIFQTILKARQNEIPWRDITAHFRQLRLGYRQGNAISLFAHLAAAYDDYIRRFPATTHNARIGGVNNLLEAIEDISETVSENTSLSHLT